MKVNYSIVPLTDEHWCCLAVSGGFDPGGPKRWTVLWVGDSKGCKDCILIQEIEPPADETGSEDSLGRFLLFGKLS